MLAKDQMFEDLDELTELSAEEMAKKCGGASTITPHQWDVAGHNLYNQAETALGHSHFNKALSDFENASAYFQKGDDTSNETLANEMDAGLYDSAAAGQPGISASQQGTLFAHAAENFHAAGDATDATNNYNAAITDLNSVATNSNNYAGTIGSDYHELGKMEGAFGHENQASKDSDLSHAYEAEAVTGADLANGSFAAAGKLNDIAGKYFAEAGAVNHAENAIKTAASDWGTAANGGGQNELVDAENAARDYSQFSDQQDQLSAAQYYTVAGQLLLNSIESPAKEALGHEDLQKSGNIYATLAGEAMNSDNYQQAQTLYTDAESQYQAGGATNREAFSEEMATGLSDAIAAAAVSNTADFASETQGQDYQEAATAFQEAGDQKDATNNSNAASYDFALFNQEENENNGTSNNDSGYGIGG